MESEFLQIFIHTLSIYFSPKHSNGFVAVDLSIDQKPDREDEMRRIIESGGRVFEWGVPRVWLKVSLCVSLCFFLKKNSLSLILLFCCQTFFFVGGRSSWACYVSFFW